MTTFFAKLYTKAPDGATLPQHILSSVKISLTGYVFGAAFGIPMGILMGWNKRIDMFVRPVFDLIKPIPGLAWIPLMVILFGIGIISKEAVIFIAVMKPCLLNAYAGVKSTREVHLWVARTFGASRRQMLFKIAIPSALPLVMTGLRVSIGNAWTTIVAAELLASTKGLGFMIQQSRGLYRPDVTFAGMIAIGLIGAALSMTLTFIESKVVKGRSKS